MYQEQRDTGHAIQQCLPQSYGMLELDQATHNIELACKMSILPIFFFAGCGMNIWFYVWTTENEKVSNHR